MKKQKSYVDCTWCQNWTKQERAERSVCTRCLNKQMLLAPEEMLCNLCGQFMCSNITVKSGKWLSDYPLGLYDVKITGGYESYHLSDGTDYIFSFCEKCLRDLFIKCKIKPTVIDKFSYIEESSEPVAEGTNPEWEEDQKNYEYRLWKDSGADHDAYVNGKCNMVKDCANDAIYTREINGKFSEDCACEDHKGTNGGSYKYVKFISNSLKVFL